MRKSKKFIGIPVISLAEGQQMGTVKGLVVDPVQQNVAALLIDQKGWFNGQKFVPYNKVRSVGTDAITIDQGAVVEKGTSLPDILKLYKDKVHIIGCKVIVENGSQLGEVVDFFVDEVSGQLVGLEISGNFLNSLLKGRSFLEITFVKTIGKELVVTSSDAMDNLVKIDGGLQETVKQLKESTNQIWETTVQKTKEIGTITKELSSKTVEDIETKTKDLGESIRDKVKRKVNEETVEDEVKVQDLPPGALKQEGVALTREEPVQDEVLVEELPPGALPRQEEELLTRLEQLQDSVQIHDLPPGALPREEETESVLDESKVDITKSQEIFSEVPESPVHPDKENPEKRI
ncbi:PRC-barrel domain protein [Desulforamulus reducens MI-1]|uniref:PRC-barrel domain protein n=1 Tax=Desulforamulus reducens (strain ATCC BAA-1160 / DSM 100696 / MI-1) TaxID=349161 RepID=A4J0Q4_DESRM|nr:PRC-barrel domain-containing protein [Desulforamulus reducens]ABO48657.1 PRC-barrel domain protein [Desulforamulus reducens MI-1]